MRKKDTYFIRISDSLTSNRHGIGEAALFRGLSCDDRPDYEERLDEVCKNITYYAHSPELLADYPSIRFGLETALLDYRNGGQRLLFPSPWTDGICEIDINGLIWMGDFHTMQERVQEKLADGFNCIKIKIGGIDFEEELKLLSLLRSMAPDVTIRLDANGAFDAENAIERLKRLSEFNIHSIEQPVKAGNWKLMDKICRNSPIPVALDEELIGLNSIGRKSAMLDEICPQYIVIKPSLCGGFASSSEWISLAEKRSCGWWITSALESNIGLNAIAQFTATFNLSLPQGLGTGQLFLNNITSPLTISGEKLQYAPSKEWIIPRLQWR